MPDTKRLNWHVHVCVSAYYQVTSTGMYMYVYQITSTGMYMYVYQVASTGMYILGVSGNINWHVHVSGNINWYVHVCVSGNINWYVHVCVSGNINWLVHVCVQIVYQVTSTCPPKKVVTGKIVILHKALVM